MGHREVMVADLLKEGAQLMLVGMGVVFSLLGLMVLALKGMSRFAALFPEPAVAASEPSSIQGSAGSDAAVITAITASIHAHRAGVGRKE